MDSYEEGELKSLRNYFDIVCRKCGSKDEVVVNLERGIDYGGETGYQPGSLQIGCNACKNNDYYLWL